MSVSVVLYRIPGINSRDELVVKDFLFDKLRSVNLYKITQDLGIIFMNKVDPFENPDALEYKMLYGSYASIQFEDRIINGILTTSEVNEIYKWIDNYSVGTSEGFERMYNRLTDEVKKELYEIGADEKVGLFNGYVLPLTQFYKEAIKNGEAVIFCGE